MLSQPACMALWLTGTAETARTDAALNPYYNYNTRSNMQVASLQAATSKLQQNVSQLPEKRQRGRNWAWSPICQSNRYKQHQTTC